MAKLPEQHWENPASATLRIILLNPDVKDKQLMVYVSGPECKQQLHKVDVAIASSSAISNLTFLKVKISESNTFWNLIVATNTCHVFVVGHSPGYIWLALVP